MITIFKTGEFDYSDADIDKPVRYTVENLIEVASRTSEVEITNEHNDDEVIGVMDNFIVKDGLLRAKEPQNLELSGMGFSPVFEYNLVDMGDHYEPTDIKMTKIGYTKSPRSRIVYNSIIVPNSEGNKMDDTQLRDALDTNKKLNEEIGSLKSQINQLKKNIEEKENEINSIKESYKDIDDKIKEYDSLKEIETQYNSLISSQKDDLIHQIAGDDKELAESIKDYSIAQLKTSLKLKTGSVPPKGVGSNGNHVDDGTDPVLEDDDTPNEEEAIKFYEETFGEKPSFIKE